MRFSTSVSSAVRLQTTSGAIPRLPTFQFQPGTPSTADRPSRPPGLSSFLPSMFQFQLSPARAMDARAPTTPPMAPSPRAPPQLPDEIVENIFVRVPPDDPARLLRAALACKRWARLFADRGFRRRYCERHRTAPVLGLLANLADTGGVARFIPTCGFCLPRAAADRHGYRAHDARHGRVLLNRVPGTDVPQGQDQESALAVWSPTTGEQWHLPLLLRQRPVRNWSAAVLCDAPGACDHVDCHAGPFSVVFVGIDANQIFAHRNSSVSGDWNEGTSTMLAGDLLDVDLPGVLAWDALHFVFLKGTRILRCNLATGELSVIRVPRKPSYGSRMALVAMEDTRLVFSEVVSFRSGTLSLRLWSLEIGADGNAGPWALRRAIELNNKLPADALNLSWTTPIVVAFADGIGVIFLKTSDGLYGFDLKSGKATKVSMTSCLYDIIPFVSFYTPVIGAALVTSGKGSSACASTSA